MDVFLWLWGLFCRWSVLGAQSGRGSGNEAGECRGGQKHVPVDSHGLASPLLLSHGGGLSGLDSQRARSRTRQAVRQSVQREYTKNSQDSPPWVDIRLSGRKSLHRMGRKIGNRRRITRALGERELSLDLPRGGLRTDRTQRRRRIRAAPNRGFRASIRCFARRPPSYPCTSSPTLPNSCRRRRRGQ